MPYFLDIPHNTNTRIIVGIVAFAFVIALTTLLQLGAFYQHQRSINQIRPSNSVLAIVNSGLNNMINNVEATTTNKGENQENVHINARLNANMLKGGQKSLSNQRISIKEGHVMIPKLSKQHAVLGLGTSLIVLTTWLPFVICLYLVKQVDDHAVIFTTILWYMTGLFMFCLYGFCETRIRKELFSKCCK